jgi:hypothetical protein
MFTYLRNFIYENLVVKSVGLNLLSLLGFSYFLLLLFLLQVVRKPVRLVVLLIYLCT